MNETSERWMPVVGADGLYEVSNQGRVRSLRSGRLLKPYQRLGGYKTVHITQEGVTKTQYVHLLVIEAFVGQRPDGQQTRHLNGKPSDNRLANLAYGTPKENSDDKIRHGSHPDQLRDELCKNGHKLIEPNLTPSNRTRKCLACNRARRLPPGFEGTREELADRWFGMIMTYGREESVRRMGFDAERRTANGYMQWNNKLSWNSVDQIRAWHREGRKRSWIASQLGVSRTTVGNVTSGKAWTEKNRPIAERAATSPVDPTRTDGRAADRSRPGRSPRKSA